MNPKQASPSSPGISLGDVYYILFRYKWLIAILSVLAVTAASVVRSTCSVPYESEAKLMIKYVHENKPPAPGPNAVSTGDIQGDNAVNSEIEILTSADLASNVVDVLGATKILAKVDGGTNPVEAISVVRSGLMAMPANRSDVVEIVFTHPDAGMVQPILAAIIDAYLKKHHQIHQGPGFVDFLQKQMEEVQGTLSDMDRQYQLLKQQAGISYSSIVDSEKSASDQVARILNEKLGAEAEYASYQVVIKEMQAALALASGSTNAAASSNNAASIPRDKIASYRRLCQQLNNLEAQEDEMLLKYTPTSSQFQGIQAQAGRIGGLKKQLEDKYPALANMELATANGPTLDPRVILREQTTKRDALAARIQMLTDQLAQAQTNTAVMSSYEGKITQLLRQKAIKEEEFSFYARQLDEAKVKEEVGSGTNISPVEAPTDPSRDLRKFNKIIAGILFGGLAFAFALPFVIELYLDRTLKRPLDVRARLGLPFFISIPLMNGNGGRRALKHAKKVVLLPANPKESSEPATAGQPPAPKTNGHLTLWEQNHGLQPFYETLRDRLMTYFEVINLTHKPKLVAVTSCSAGAGVTSTAAGLAASLSETGEGNVLLVNMNVRDGEAHHFYKGKLNCGLDEVLEKGTRAGAFVQGNLYVAKEQPEDDRLPRVLPKRFSHLLPKMKASDFDYIIFDMPPVNQISITPRIAKFMDMVLLVVESGKTDRDVAARAAAVLAETKTNVGVVLNKNRSYGPRRHLHDI